MSIKETVIKKAIEVLWPWFKEIVWPILQQYIIELITSAISGLVALIKRTFSEKSNQRAEEANANAAAAESKAQNSNPESNDYYTYKAEAEVWRKVAKQYEADIKDLKEKIDELEKNSKEDVSKQVEESTPDIKTASETTTLKIGEVTHSLPRLEKSDG